MKHPVCRWLLGAALLPAVPGGMAAAPVDSLTVPDGFVVESAVLPGLVDFPMMACFDERGRLFLAESAGHNLSEKQLEAERPNRIRMLEDTDGDGVFDRSTIFADRLALPNGVLWLDGSLHIAEVPGIWRFTDTDGDGVADRREHVTGRIRSNGMSSTLHGPSLHPGGKLFWCGGQLGWSTDKNAEPPGGRMNPGTFWFDADGGNHEVFAIGGLANPVEVAFSAEGEVFGTVAILDNSGGTRHDALMHWVYGGVYHVREGTPVGLPRTGPTLPPLSHVGQVAPAGLTRYRGIQFGDEYVNDLFWSQFNLHKIVRTRLTRAGASFKSRDEDFLVSSDVDFHPTDALEDADGSLLVIDTGGWFRHGCPTSQIARPQVKGGIFRVRRKGARPPEDPRGLRIDWANLAPPALGQLLGDDRPFVQDRAIELLGKGSDAAVAELGRLLARGPSITARRNAVWVLARSGSPSAPAALRVALEDRADSVRQSAAMALGMRRDAGARDALDRLVVDDSGAAIRREAAAALGRMGDPRSVPALLHALRQPVDEFLTHAVIFALIQINHPAATMAGLTNASPAARRGALLALNEMPEARLTHRQIAPLLAATDPALLRAACGVAARTPGMMPDLARALRDHLRAAREDSADELRAVLDDLSGETPVQTVIAETLADPGTPPRSQSMLLGVMAASRAKQLPRTWERAVGELAKRGGLEIRAAAIQLIQQRRLAAFDGPLTALALDAAQPAGLRMAALDAVAPRLTPVGGDLVDWLLDEAGTAVLPLTRLEAARTLAGLKLSPAQRLQLTAALPRLDALVLPTLLRAFNAQPDSATGLALVRALRETAAARSLPGDELARIVARFPVDVQTEAAALLQQLGVDPAGQQRRLAELEPLLTGGDFSRGKQVFFGPKAACATCHRVHGAGGGLGPNLTTIAQIRTGRDLLESIVFPGASIVQGFHPFNVDTTDDQSFSGLIVRRTPEAIWLRGTDLAEHRIPVERIKSLRESTVSIMPQGLDTTLTPAELRDLLAYLQGLKRISSYQLDRP